jgi:putative flippase GtrA
LLNAFGVWCLGRFGVPYGGARVATALVVSVAWNFPMHRAFVFAAAPEGSEAEPEHAGTDRRLDDAHVRS